MSTINMLPQLKVILNYFYFYYHSFISGAVSFTVEVLDLLEAPTDVHVDVIWGDDSPKETLLLTPDINSRNESTLKTVLEHEFKTFGDYKIKMLIRNDVSNFTREFKVRFLL